jgi:alkanesulfonate monooxygenase SsuD/methylene tetrahydromethanopterin reductase-like flavin-dependent oxidoreductase (luciferase family)
MTATGSTASGGRPFAPGSVSLRLYPHDDLDAPAIVREMCDQAAIGLRGGFDGIMTSEHHGGFGGYIPNPMQMTSFILEENERGWAAACPMLLPLRPTAQVAEEIAWLDARHPGRVGLGVAAGARPLDFECMDVPLAEAVPRFKAELPRVVDMLRGRDLRGLDGDQAFQRCAAHPIPVLSAAISPAAARRAAGCGAGILTEGMSSAEQLARLCRTYTEAGGTGTKMLIRRVWLGEPLTELVDRQRAVYQSVSNSSRPFGDDQTIATLDAGEMAERLGRTVEDIGADAINLRVHLPGITPTAVRDQIARLSEEVVPALRRHLASIRPIDAATA